jgi:hypothetical protein
MRASHADRSKNSRPEESLQKQVIEVFCEELCRFLLTFYEQVFILAFFDEGHSMVEVSALFVLLSSKKKFRSKLVDQ